MVLVENSLSIQYTALWQYTLALYREIKRAIETLVKHDMAIDVNKLNTIKKSTIGSLLGQARSLLKQTSQTQISLNVRFFPNLLVVFS